MRNKTRFDVEVRGLLINKFYSIKASETAV